MNVLTGSCFLVLLPALVTARESISSDTDYLFLREHAAIQNATIEIEVNSVTSNLAKDTPTPSLEIYFKGCLATGTKLGYVRSEEEVKNLVKHKVPVASLKATSINGSLSLSAQDYDPIQYKSEEKYGRTVFLLETWEWDPISTNETYTETHLDLAWLPTVGSVTFADEGMHRLRVAGAVRLEVPGVEYAVPRDSLAHRIQLWWADGKTPIEVWLKAVEISLEAAEDAGLDFYAPIPDSLQEELDQFRVGVIRSLMLTEERNSDGKEAGAAALGKAIAKSHLASFFMGMRPEQRAEYLGPHTTAEIGESLFDALALTWKARGSRKDAEKAAKKIQKALEKEASKAKEGPGFLDRFFDQND